MPEVSYLETPTSWPRRASPCELVPRWAGEFRSHGDWVSFATHRLTGVRGSVGEEVKAICVDSFGRRCNVGADFKRAEEEGAFPVRYFWECEPAPSPWANIDSAPKDGRYIIVARFVGNGELKWITHSRWITAQEVAEEHGGSPDDYEAGWTAGDDEDDPCYPTHWQKLQAPTPAQGPEGGAA